MKTAFVFDLDGTVTKQEMLPIIAKEVGLENEMKTLTDLTIRGLVSFEESFKLRFAMLRSISVERVRNAVEDVEFDPYIASFIQENRENCFIVTGNLYPWILGIRERINCKFFCNDAQQIGDILTNLSPLMLKSAPIYELRSQFERVVAIGEGANDVPMFEAADIGIAYGGVHEPYKNLLEISNYIVYRSESLCNLLNTL